MSDLTFPQGSDPTCIFNDTSGNQMAVNTDGSINTSDIIAQGATTSGKLGNLTLGAVTTAAPTYIDSQLDPLSLDTVGNLRVVLAANQTPINVIPFLQSTSPVSYATLGSITTTSATTTIIGSFTEQATGAQRSIVSSSAADAAAGTGVRTVLITYYTQTGTGTLSGPFTEIITMNGLTAVNTVATNIRYVEKLEAVTVGSGGNAAGNIQLMTGIGGTGSAFNFIAAGAVTTINAVHYVPTGKTALISDIYVTSTVLATNTALFYIIWQDYGIANGAGRILQNYMYSNVGVGTAISNLTLPRKVVGPARISGWVTTPTSVSQVSSMVWTLYEV